MISFCDLHREQLSIPSTFSACIFCKYFGAQNYKAETFDFVIFWRQKIGKKCARKMLMKLTTEYNENRSKEE